VKVKKLHKDEKLLKLIKSHYTLIHSFTIFGSPARKSNQRQFTLTSFVLGKQAINYINVFEKQIKRLKFPDLNSRDFLWVFEIWYNNKLADASIELIFDIMQKAEVIKNDNNIRKYYVGAEDLDYEVPRTKVYIYKP
jgi:hypothetical protein